MNKDSRIYVAGHRGMVGSALLRALAKRGCGHVITATREQCDLAVQEDVDVVGISTLSAGHTRSLPKLARLLREAGAGDKLLVAGGVIPEEDKPILEEAGVDRIFTMGSDTRDIVAYLESWWAARLAEDAA